MKKKTNTISWILQIIAAAIIMMTVIPKFMGAPEPVSLFTKLGMEPGGRYIIASVELLACLLLLIPASAIYGAVLAAGVMAGAIMGHFTKLGFEGMMGQMFGMAIVVFLSSLVVIYLRRRQLPIINKMFSSESSK